MSLPHIPTLEQARAAKLKAVQQFADLPLVGVGITRIGEGYALKLNFSEAVAENAVPGEVDGVPIKTEVVGSLRKQ